jgi:hypothetical protein
MLEINDKEGLLAASASTLIAEPETFHIQNISIIFTTNPISYLFGK